MRVALCVEYDGSAFHGWQRQPGLRTVQGCLEEGLSKIADHDITINCAGRTDTGVHAIGQIIHFDTITEREKRAWIYGTNSNVDKDISVRWTRYVDDDFHARYSAVSRRYRYVIYNRQVRSAIFRGAVAWSFQELDENAMDTAAQSLLGERDFTSFRALNCQSKTPMRNIESISVKRRGPYVIIDVTANAFLHHMVRNIAGVLIDIGSGKQKPEWMQEVLEAKDRNKGAATGSPYGLYLVHVKYPEKFRFPKPTLGPLFI